MTPEMIDMLNTLIKEIEKTHDGSGGVGANDLIPGTVLCDDALLNELVFSMLLWESSFEHAKKAAGRISEELVDLNELRVCTGDELALIMGARMPRGGERARRLLRVLNEIYDRENTLSLSVFSEMSKREVQEYLEGIDGLPRFVSARVILMGLDWHAFPLDERLAKLLGSKNIITASEALNHQAAQLERGVRASDSLRTYTLIEHWAQNQRGSSRSPKPRGGKKTTKGVSS